MLTLGILLQLQLINVSASILEVAKLAKAANSAAVIQSAPIQYDVM